MSTFIFRKAVRILSLRIWIVSSGVMFSWNALDILPKSSAAGRFCATKYISVLFVFGTLIFMRIVSTLGLTRAERRAILLIWSNHPIGFAISLPVSFLIIAYADASHKETMPVMAVWTVFLPSMPFFSITGNRVLALSMKYAWKAGSTRRSIRTTFASVMDFEYSENSFSLKGSDTSFWVFRSHCSSHFV